MKAKLEKVDLKEDESIHAFIYSKKEFDAPWHFHPEYELTLVLKSSGIRYVGNNISSFQEGELVLLGGNLPHCWKNEGLTQDESSSLVIQWKKKVIADLPSFENIRKLLVQAQRGLLIESTNKERIIELMYELLRANTIVRYLKLIELLHELSIHPQHLQLAGSSYSSDLSEAAISRLDIIQTFVKDNYQTKITLADIAIKLKMNEQSFSRYFSKAMNRPFFAYVNEYRINIASRLIHETDWQISEIAYKCGYESLPFFYRQFKKFKNTSPLHFRDMYQRASEEN